MGISKGSFFYKLFKHGLYQKKPKIVRIHVDGENIWYKGCVSEGMNAVNVESEIANIAHMYLVSLKLEIEQLLGLKSIDPENVFIWMDGARNIYKENRDYVLKFDKRVVRKEFTSLLKFYGYQIKQLNEGESELIMYHDRNKKFPLNCDTYDYSSEKLEEVEVDLNVFISNDSDMFSICYNHRPKTTESFETISLVSTDPITHLRFIDSNYTYPDYLKVTDSCVWISTNPRSVQVIGFDFCQDRLHLNPKPFQILTIMCGNDYYRKHMLSNTSIESIIDFIITKSDQTRNFLQFINSLDDCIEVCVMFLFIAIYNNSSLVKMDKNDFLNPDLKNFYFIINRYINYIESKSMYLYSPQETKASSVVKFLILNMMNEMDCIKFPTLKMRTQWAKNKSFTSVLNDFRSSILKIQPDYKLQAENILKRLEIAKLNHQRFMKL